MISRIPEKFISCGICIAFVLALCTYYLLPADPALTVDSLEYLARRYTEPLHPHHLVWVYVLHGGADAARWLTGLDIVRSAQIFQAVVSAAGALLFGLLLQRRCELPAAVAWAWAAVLGVTAGYSNLAQEAEGYNAAIGLYLAALLALPKPDSQWNRAAITRYTVALGLFVFAVCNHQLFALAVVPIIFYHWRPLARFPVRAVSFCVASGAICLLAYIVAYLGQHYRVGFINWLTLYSGSMPVFGQVEHLTTPYFIHRLMANLLAASAFDPVPMIKTASEAGTAVPLIAKLLLAGGYVLWLMLTVSALIVLFSRKAFYRAFAAWYLVFEGFLWYWAPWLLQMQVLVMPAAIGVLAFAWHSLALRVPVKSRSPLEIALPIFLIFVVIITTRLVQQPRLGSVTMDEARDFYARNDELTISDKSIMLLYEYGSSRPYMIELGEAVSTRVASIDDRAPEHIKKLMRQSATEKATHVLLEGGDVLIHKSLLLDAPGECGVRQIVETLSKSPGITFNHTRLLSTGDSKPVALQLSAQSSAAQDDDTTSTSATSLPEIHQQIRQLATEATLTTAPVLCD